MNSCKIKYKTSHLIYATLIAGFISLSCARSFNPDIQRGSTYEYQAGYPEIRLSTIGILNEDNQPLIKLTSDIVFGSLIYKKEDEQFRADITVEIQVKDTDAKQVVKTEQFSYEIKEEDNSIASRQDVFTLRKEIQTKPGNYEIYFTVLDRNSGKHSTRTSQTQIPDPNSEIASLTGIQLLGKEIDKKNSEWVPVTTYDVPAKIDSLKFVLQATNNNENNPLTLNSKLSRFLADTTAARPLHYNNISKGDIRNKGINYGEEEIVQTNRRTLIEEGSVLIEYIFPRHRHGNYRFEVTAETESGKDDLFKARDYSVKSTNYPSVKNIREMARPLVYLMSEGEYENLMSISNDDTLKNEIDKFWLKNVGNKSITRHVIRLFYERVEEANKQFSNFKEGWKTDAGMLYILFGPPWYVQRSLDKMQWSYSYNRGDPEYNYNFQRTVMPSEFYPFNNYILDRSQHYFTVQYQQKQRWLNGHILIRPL